jgi:hypothetical protein
MMGQLVAKEHGGSYAWRAQRTLTDQQGFLRRDAQGNIFEDAEDFPHSQAYEPNGIEPPRLPWNVALSPRFTAGEYMFYLGGS